MVRLVIAGDIEMGAGGPTDDCPHSADIAELLASYGDSGVEYVFNGDTFDFLKTSVDGQYPRYVTEAVALAKFERIAAAHEGFFDRLRALLARPGRTATFIVGNHDFELFFPAVQAALRERLGAEVHFPGMTYVVGDVRIEHGCQGDPLFAIDPNDPFIEHRGERILDLPWGAVGLLDTVLPYQSDFYVLDRIRPKPMLFEVLPEAQAFVTALARRYWLGSYWHDLVVEGDPLTRLRPQILREVAYRMISKDADVTFGDHYLAALRDDPAARVYVVGHEHVGRTLVEGDRTLIVTGCLRDEFVLDRSTEQLRPAPRSIAVVDTDGVRARDARLVYVPTSDAALDRVPDDLRSFAPVLRERLEELEPPDLRPLFSMALTRFRRRKRNERRY